MSLLRREAQAKERAAGNAPAAQSPAAPSPATPAATPAAVPPAGSAAAPSDPRPDASPRPATAPGTAVAPVAPTAAIAPAVPASPAVIASPTAPATPTIPATPGTASAPAAASTARLASSVTGRDQLLLDLRVQLHAEVVGSFDSLLGVTDAADLRARVTTLVERVIGQAQIGVTRDERLRFIDEVIDEITGLGPLEPLLADETITEIMVNGPRQIYIERRGKILRVDSAFMGDEHVLRIIDRIIAPLGRRIDESSPRVDARLPDGSRVNVIIEPLSLVGPVITIRKFAARPYTVEDLVGFGTSTAEMFEFLRVCVEARLNIFVSGGTGSGKTTFLNVLSSFIPNDERIITVEDAAELQLRQDHVVTLEARPPNLEGEGEITIRDLIRNALHMRPDRIIVGECRSGEALDMLQAMNSGQEGSLSTGHANTPPDMLRRLETMVLMTGYELPLRAIREQIASAVDVIVHTARLKDGSRKVVNITEVYGIEDDDILTQDIFAFEQTGVVDGRIQGHLSPTGIRPTFMRKLIASGVALPPGEFGIPPEDPARPGPLGKGRWGAGESAQGSDVSGARVGRGRVIKAGGMVYVSSIGPVDPETGRVVSSEIREQTRQCLRNLKSSLESAGSSLDKVVWANWSLREPVEFDTFNEEWARWFPGDAPVGQGTLLPPLHRRAGFRVSIGVIAEG
ncbi:MAG TPA: ATPase, T2SS/T4P/T4SS family [Candidatus Saccharimonadales bacterium]|nr:ATPase, T2SS/T4P/T4SS family [Candidatus Saccharimonadales bacterium]